MLEVHSTFPMPGWYSKLQTPPSPKLFLHAVGGQGAWATRSKASLLLALVIKRSGPELWEAALPQLVAAAAEGPVLQVGCQWLSHAMRDGVGFVDAGGA